MVDTPTSNTPAATDASIIPPSGVVVPEGVDYAKSIDPKHKAKSNDPAWKYGYIDNLLFRNNVTCTLCGFVSKGGIKRLKEHLAGGYGDATRCPNVPSEVAKEMHNYRQANKRGIPLVLDEEDEVEEASSRAQSISIESSGGSSFPKRTQNSTFPSSGTASKKKKIFVPATAGPIKNQLRRTPEEIVDGRKSKEGYQKTIHEAFSRAPEERDRVVGHIADWFYECGIPFNTSNARSFEVMIESIGQYGSGLKPPTYHELRVPLLEKAKKKTDDYKKVHEASWKQHGCTLMSDGWTDKRGRHLINFLVNSPIGTYFMGSMDASSKVQDANMLFELLDSKIQEIGPEYVVQVISDNAANYKAAGKRLMEKRPTLYWTPCAAHCIDLMMEDIGEIKENKATITQAKRITTFIYRHTLLLDAMRSKTGGKDLVRPAVTRFATSFLTLQSLYKFKDALKQLFVSDDWRTSKLASTEAGKKITEIILSVRFWNGVEDCIRASQPLLVVLRIVDGDERPAMPEVYAAMEEAKGRIKENFHKKERLYRKVINIIEKRWECQMEQKLYSARLFLNPGKYFKFIEKNHHLAMKLLTDFDEVLVRMVPDKELYDKISSQLDNYRAVRHGFDKEHVIRARETKSPIDWWRWYGGFAGKEATEFASRILGLCCSSSGCERNWNTFEFIHTKKRNRLEHKRLNDLVYIQYNRRLEARMKQRSEQGRNFDPLALEDLDWSSEWMVNYGQDDLVHLEDGADGLTWRDVDVAIGASSGLECRTSRRIRGSTSDTSIVYSHRTRTIGVDSDSDVEIGEAADVDEDPEDDINMDDDFGGMPEVPSSQNTSSSRGNIVLDDFI